MIEQLKSQKLITEAQIKALDAMNAAEMWGLMIMLKASVKEIDRQIDELESEDIL